MRRILTVYLFLFSWNVSNAESAEKFSPYNYAQTKFEQADATEFVLFENDSRRLLTPEELRKNKYSTDSNAIFELGERLMYSDDTNKQQEGIAILESKAKHGDKRSASALAAAYSGKLYGKKYKCHFDEKKFDEYALLAASLGDEEYAEYLFAKNITDKDKLLAISKKILTGAENPRIAELCWRVFNNCRKPILRATHPYKNRVFAPEWNAQFTFEDSELNFYLAQKLAKAVDYPDNSALILHYYCATNDTQSANDIAKSMLASENFCQKIFAQAYFARLNNSKELLTKIVEENKDNLEYAMYAAMRLRSNFAVPAKVQPNLDSTLLLKKIADCAKDPKYFEPALLYGFRPLEKIYDGVFSASEEAPQKLSNLRKDFAFYEEAYAKNNLGNFSLESNKLPSVDDFKKAVFTTTDNSTKAALNAAKIANYYCILANDNSSRKEVTKRIENMMNQIFNTQEISTINQAIKNCQPDWELYLSLENSNTSQKNFKLSLILK